jgi:hypothetical protein
MLTRIAVVLERLAFISEQQMMDSTRDGLSVKESQRIATKLNQLKINEMEREERDRHWHYYPDPDPVRERTADESEKLDVDLSDI